MNKQEIKNKISELDKSMDHIKNNMNMHTDLLDKVYNSGRWQYWTSSQMFGFYFNKYYDSEFTHSKPELRDLVNEIAKTHLEIDKLEMEYKDGLQ